MRLEAAIMAGALVLAPVFAIAAEPVFVQVDGKPVAAHATTRIVQTAAGPAQVKTWSWHSPGGNASFVMQTSTSGGVSPEAARRMQAQMQARMAEMANLQASMQVQMQQMMALQQAAFGGMPAMAGMPVDAMFGAPPMVLMQAPQPVLYLVPVAPVAPSAKAATPAARPAPVPVHAPAGSGEHRRGVDI